MAWVTLWRESQDASICMRSGYTLVKKRPWPYLFNMTHLARSTAKRVRDYAFTAPIFYYQGTYTKIPPVHEKPGCWICWHTTSQHKTCLQLRTYQGHITSDVISMQMVNFSISRLVPRNKRGSNIQLYGHYLTHYYKRHHVTTFISN